MRDQVEHVGQCYRCRQYVAAKVELLGLWVGLTCGCAEAIARRLEDDQRATAEIEALEVYELGGEG